MESIAYENGMGIATIIGDNLKGDKMNKIYVPIINVLNFQQVYLIE